jgi:putative tryptophan/tyrosine transport system substrate-binding protein
MKRREFMTLAGCVAAWPLAARGELQSKMPRIGVLAPGPSQGPDASRLMANGLVAGLHELGHDEGRNIIVESKYGESNADRLRQGAEELVKREVDVIIAFSTTAARPAKAATSRIPIVAVAMADPVEDGLVASLSRPGGNVTGTTFLGPELVSKRLQLLREVVPKNARVAVLWHPQAYSDRTMAGMVKEAEQAAQTLGMQLRFIPASNPEEITGALSALTREQVDGLIVFPSPVLFAAYGHIARMCAEKGLPLIYAAREGAEEGGLMSYGANLPDLARQTASYVDKILKGARPAELPVQAPTRFEFIINLKAANALGLTISRDFLLIADEVIE